METPCWRGVAGRVAEYSSGGHAVCVAAAPGPVVVGSSGVGSGPFGDLREFDSAASPCV